MASGRYGAHGGLGGPGGQAFAGGQIAQGGEIGQGDRTGPQGPGAARGEGAARGQGVYRSRAVTISGIVDSVLGGALVLVGSLEAAGSHTSLGLTLGLALVMVGLLIGCAGFARIVSRLEVHDTKIVWTWAFTRHEHSLEDLTEAALVEPGSPSSGTGAAGAAFIIPLGLGVLGAFALIGTFISAFKAGPTLGSHTLIAIRRFGAPLRIQAIGTFAFYPERSSAAVAERALQAAIASFHARFGQHDV